MNDRDRKRRIISPSASWNINYPKINRLLNVPPLRKKIPTNPWDPVTNLRRQKLPRSARTKIESATGSRDQNWLVAKNSPLASLQRSHRQRSKIERQIYCLPPPPHQRFALSRYNTLKGWNPLSKNCFKQHQREFWICWMKFAKNFAYWRGCLGQRPMSNNSMRTIFRLLGSHMNNIFLLSSFFFSKSSAKFVYC